MKHFLPFLIIGAGAALFPPGAGAWTMNVATGSSEPEIIEAAPGTRIVFSDDHSSMIVSTADSDSPRSFDIDDIVNITFTFDSGVECLPSDFGDIRISNSGGILTASGPDVIKYAVWDSTGALVTEGSCHQLVTIDFTSHAPGIYIFKVNNRTFKFINR